MTRKWENNSNSKLQYIKPSIEEWESVISYKQYQVKLSRTLIGHARLTHIHLMIIKDEQPTCINAVTMKLYLVECPK